MPNPVVHVEIAGSDDAKIRQFYRDAFDWEVAAGNPMQYGLVQPRGEGIRGCIGAGPAPSVTRCNSPEYVPHIFYVQVDDPEATLARVRALGGEAVQEITVIPGM